MKRFILSLGLSLLTILLLGSNLAAMQPNPAEVSSKPLMVSELTEKMKQGSSITDLIKQMQQQSPEKFPYQVDFWPEYEANGEPNLITESSDSNGDFSSTQITDLKNKPHSRTYICCQNNRPTSAQTILFNPSSFFKKFKKRIDCLLSQETQRQLKLLSICLGAYGICYTNTFCHELGHALTDVCLLSGSFGTISINPLGGGGFYTPNQRPEPQFETPARMVFHLSAGCLAGLIANYGILKIMNIVSECIKNKDNSMQTIMKGLKKPLFNKDQNQVFQTLVILQASSQITNLIPLPHRFREPIEFAHRNYNDGNLILRALNVSYISRKYQPLFGLIHSMKIFADLYGTLALAGYLQELKVRK